MAESRPPLPPFQAGGSRRDQRGRPASGRRVSLGITAPPSFSLLARTANSVAMNFGVDQWRKSVLRLSLAVVDGNDVTAQGNGLANQRRSARLSIHEYVEMPPRLSALRGLPTDR